MLKGFWGYVRDLLEDTEALDSDGSSSCCSCQLDDDADVGDANNPRGHGHKSRRKYSACSSSASASSQCDGYRTESDAFVDELFEGERDTEGYTSFLVNTHTEVKSDVRRITAISRKAVRSMRATTMLPPPRHQKMFRRPLFVVFDLDGTLLKEALSSSLTADLLSRYRRHVEDAHMWEERLNSCFMHADTRHNNSNNNNTNNTQCKTFSHELHFETTKEIGLSQRDSKKGEQRDVEEGSQTDLSHRSTCNMMSDNDIAFLRSEYKRSLRELDSFAKTVVGTVFKDPSFALTFLTFLHESKGHYVRIATFAQESTEAKIEGSSSPFRFANQSPHNAAANTNASLDVDAHHLQGCDLKRSSDLPTCDHAPTPLFSASSSFAACAQGSPLTRAWATHRSLGKDTPLLGMERSRGSGSTLIQGSSGKVATSPVGAVSYKPALQHRAKRSVVDPGLFQAADDLSPSGGGDLDALFSLVAVEERDVHPTASTSPAVLSGGGRLQVQKSTQQPVHDVHTRCGTNDSPNKGGEGHTQQTQCYPFDDDDGLRPSHPFALDVQGPSSESGSEEDVPFSISQRPCRDSAAKEADPLDANIPNSDLTAAGGGGGDDNSVDISGEESCSSAPKPTTDDDSTSEAYRPCLHSKQWGESVSSAPPPPNGDTCSNRNLFTISASTTMHLYDVSVTSASANYFNTATAAAAAKNISSDITTVLVLSGSPPRSQNTFRRGSSVSMATSGLGLQTSSSGDAEASPTLSGDADTFSLTHGISGGQLHPNRSQSGYADNDNITRLLPSGGQHTYLSTDLMAMGNFSFATERRQPDRHVFISAKRKSESSQRTEDRSPRQLRQEEEEEGTVSLELRRSRGQNEENSMPTLEKSKGSPPLPLYVAVSSSPMHLFDSCPAQSDESPLSPQQHHHAIGRGESTTTRDTLRPPAQWTQRGDGTRMLIPVPEDQEPIDVEEDGEDGDGDECVGCEVDDNYGLDHASTATYYATARNSYQGGLERSAGIEGVGGGGRGEESGGPLPSFCSSSVRSRSRGDRSRDYSLRAGQSSYATAQGIHEVPFQCPSRRSSYGGFAPENDTDYHLDGDDDDDVSSSHDLSSIDKRTAAALSACTTVAMDAPRAPPPPSTRTVDDTLPTDAFASTLDASPLGSYVPTTDHEGHPPLQRHLMASIDSKWEVVDGQGHESRGLQAISNNDTSDADDELTPPKRTDSEDKSSSPPRNSTENTNRQLDMGTENKARLHGDERARCERATNANAPAANVSCVVSGGPSSPGRKEGTDPSDLAANSSTQGTGTFSASTSCRSPTRLSLATFPSTTVVRRVAGADMWSKMRSTESDGDTFSIAGVDGRTPRSDRIMPNVPLGIGSAQRSYYSDKERAVGSYLPQPTSIVGSGEFVPEEDSCGRGGGRRQRDSLRSEFDCGSRSDPSRMRGSAESSEFRGYGNKTPPRSPPILSELALGPTFPLGFALGATSGGTPLRRVNVNYLSSSESTAAFRNSRAADQGRTWETKSVWGQGHTANTKRESYVTFSPSVLPQAFAPPGASELPRVQDTPAEWVSSGVLPPYTYASGSFACSQTPVHSSFTPTQLHNGSFPMPATGRASPHPLHMSHEARMGPGDACFLASLIDTSYSDPNGHGLAGSGRAAMVDESPVPMIRPAVSYRRHLRGDVGTSRSQSHGSLPSSFSTNQARASTHSPIPRKGLATGELPTKGHAPFLDHHATSVSASGFFDAPGTGFGFFGTPRHDGKHNQDTRVEGREGSDRSQQITPHTVPTLYIRHRGYDKKEGQHSPTHAQYARPSSVRFPSEPTPLHLSPDRGGVRRRNIGAESLLRTPNGASVGQAMGNALASSAVGLGLPPTPPRGGPAGSKRAASTIMSSSHSTAEVPRTCVSSPVATLVIAKERDHPATTGGQPFLDCEEWKDPLAVHVHNNEVDEDISPPRPGANHQASSTRRPSLNYPPDEGHRCLTFSPADLAVMTSDRENTVYCSRVASGVATIDVAPKSRRGNSTSTNRRSEQHGMPAASASPLREQTPLDTVCSNNSNRRFAVHDILDLLDALCSARDFLVEGHDIIGWRGPSTLIGGFLNSRSRLSLTASTMSRQHSRQTVWGDEEDCDDEDIFNDDDPLPEGGENKNPHINVLLEDFMAKNPQLSRRPVSPSRVVLIDDDVNNVKAAVAVGYNAFHCPNGLTREWYASQTKLQHLLDAFEGSDF